MYSTGRIVTSVVSNAYDHVYANNTSIHSYAVSLSRSRSIGLPLRNPSSTPPRLGFLLFLDGVRGLVGRLSSSCVRSITVRLRGVLVGVPRPECNVSAFGGRRKIHPLSSMSPKNSWSKGSTWRVVREPKMTSFDRARVKETLILRQSLSRSPT